jgi:hypothetical protein
MNCQECNAPFLRPEGAGLVNYHGHRATFCVGFSWTMASTLLCDECYATFKQGGPSAVPNARMHVGIGQQMTRDRNRKA